jgi:hypothetical protein
MMTSPYEQPGQQYPPQQGQVSYHYPQQPSPYGPPPAACGPPQRAVTRRPMPISLELFHWAMMLVTCGLWLPVYLASKRSRKSVTTWR